MPSAAVPTGALGVVTAVSQVGRRRRQQCPANAKGSGPHRDRAPFRVGPISDSLVQATQVPSNQHPGSISEHLVRVARLVRSTYESAESSFRLNSDGSIAGYRYRSGSIASKSVRMRVGSTSSLASMLCTSARSCSKPRSIFDSACE